MKRILLIVLIFSLMFAGLISCDRKSEDSQAGTDTGAVDDSNPNETDGGNEETDPISTKTPSEIVNELAPDAQHILSTSSCKEVVLKGVSKDTAIKAFTNEDFKTLETTPIDGAKFETTVLLRKFDVVTMYWTKLQNELRIMWETTSTSELYMLTPTEETGKGLITVAQVGTDRVNETDNPLNGMCYVIKLGDGKAIVIDGGFNNDLCADNLYGALRSMDIEKSGDKYVIEAWIITHNHSDHSGTYKNFASRYAEKVTVNHIITAYPGSIETVSGGGEAFSAGNFSDANMINPHAGIKYYFGNAVISMLYTPDMLYSASSQIVDFNDTSLVFKVEAGDSEVFFLGDAGEVVAEKLLASYYNSSFKSDIFQMAHHGLYVTPTSGYDCNDIKKLYDAIDAECVFLPMHSYYVDAGRNGRYTVMIEWANLNFQSSYVMNESDNHGVSVMSQEYYDAFTKSVANGTNTKETLYGYDGVNKIVNEKGLVTYIGGSETKPMVTIFELSDGTVTLKTNEELYSWLGLAE